MAPNKKKNILLRFGFTVGIIEANKGTYNYTLISCYLAEKVRKPGLENKERHGLLLGRAVFSMK